MSNPPFELPAAEKAQWILAQLNGLTRFHYDRCPLYHRYLDAWGFDIGNARQLDELPWLPARAFKDLTLKSVSDENIVKTIFSSGTMGAQSKIFIDGRTTIKQSRALIEILKSYIGRKLPMLIIDAPGVGENSSAFTARSAGALGFSNFATETTYALGDDMKLNVPAVERFLSLHGHSDFIMFGFTFVVWQTFMLNALPTGFSKDFSNGRLFHGGGWKKLSALNIAEQQFRAALLETTGLQKIHNYYGMAEQTGSVFVECEHGKMHASKYSEVLVRDAATLEVLPLGAKGVIQVCSTLPESYPGHSILTEDLGWIEPDITCDCGRNGTTIHIEGRLQRAEVRGCSDVY